MRRQTRAKLLLLWMMGIFLMSCFAFFSIPAAQAISGETVAQPLYSLENIPLPSSENTTSYNYNHIVETPRQLWFSGKKNIYNWTGSSWGTIFTESGGDDGYLMIKYLGTFSGNEWFWMCSTGGGGWRRYSKNNGVSWTTSSLGGIILNSMFRLSNGTWITTQWGDTIVRKSNNDLVSWATYDNTTQRYIDTFGGSGIDWTQPPHMNLYLAQEKNRLFVEFEPVRSAGGSNHTIFMQNLQTGAWSYLKDKVTDKKENNQGFAQVTHTSQAAFFGESDGDGDDLKFMRWSEDGYYYYADLFRKYAVGTFGSGIMRTSSTGSNLIAENDVLYVPLQTAGTYAGTCSYRYGIYASPDHGITWTPLWTQFKTADYSYRKYNIYHGYYHFYIIDKENSKIYRTDYLSQAEVWNCVRSSTRAGTKLTLDGTFANQTTDQLSLSQYIINPSAKLRFVGKSYINYQTNGGFETGTTTGWTGDTSFVTVQTDVGKWEGSKWANLSYTGSGNLYLYGTQISVAEGQTPVVATAYVKAKTSKPIALAIYTDTYKAEVQTTRTIGTTWTRLTITMGYIRAGATKVYLSIGVGLASDWIGIDGVMLEANPQKSTNIGSYKINDRMYPSNYFLGTLNTQNPSIVIGGVTYSYSGTLTEGQQSPEQTVTLPSTGLAAITSIYALGSGLFSLNITATVTTIAEGFSLTYANGIGYGHYYNGTYTLTPSATDIIAYTNRTQAIITSAIYDGYSLALVVSGSTGVTSITKVYTGSQGSPRSVVGTSSYSYDLATKTLTISILHSSPARVLIFWRFAGLAVAYGTHVTDPNYSSNSDIDLDGDIDVYDLYMFAKNWKLLGDIDGDNDVDAEDLHLLAVVYGTSIGDPNYSSRSDISLDGNIDVYDLYMLARNY